MFNELKTPLEAAETLAERPRPSVFAAEALLLIAVAGLWIATIAVGALAPSDASMFLTDLAYYGPFVLLPAVIYCARRGDLQDALRLNPLPVLPALLIAMIALMSVYAASAVNGIWAAGLNALGLHEPASGPDVGASSSLMLAVLHTAAIPAVCEELLCRGAVLSAFEGRGTARAIWISSLLFALLHSNLYGLPAYALVGALSGFIVFAADSLYAGMFFHTVYNTAILVIMHLMGREENAEVLAAAEQAPAASMIGAMALDLLVVGLSLALLLNALNLRRKVLGIAPAPRARVPMTGREKALTAVLMLAFAASIAAVQALSGG